MIKLYCGYDPREAAGYYAFQDSVIENSTEPFSITPLTGKQSDGTNAFTYARFGVPEVSGFAGFAIFADASDMLLVGDLKDLWKMRDKKYAVQVVKHDYKTKHPRKYLGQDMESANEDYPRKNWSSLVIWNCGHMAHFRHRKELRSDDGAFLHRFAWLDDEEIGEIPVEWNWLADEYGENEDAKLLHWTCGMPGFYQYKNAPHASKWQQSMRRVMKGVD